MPSGHTKRMEGLGKKKSVAQQMEDDSIMTPEDVVIRSPSISETKIIIQKDSFDLITESGQGGMKLTDAKANFKKVVSVKFDNSYKDFTFEDKQFNQSLDYKPMSVISPQPLFDKQLFPAELVKIAGLAKKLKSIVGLGG